MSSPADPDDRINAAVAEYLEAVERGRAPSEADFLARHPDLADELRAFLADRRRFVQAAGAITPNPAEDSTLAPPDSSGPTSLGSIKYFGDYELLDEVARGAMGVVYKARQVSLNRVVAVKMILSGQFASPADVGRFRQEAEAAANLDHPNIVPIYEVGEHDGLQYFSMKLIDGGSLAGRVCNLVDEPRKAVALLVHVCRAVHFAHQRGILHRDLKPGNVLVDAGGTPYVSDFGLAKRIETDSRMTQSGAIVGTPSYMAPEQAAARKDLTTAVDVYALGAILYELLTGQPPFRAATPLDTLLQVMDKEPVRPRVVKPGVDRDLETIALKCLAKEPAGRYSSAEALADDLERWLRGEPIEARPAGRSERVWRWCRRNPAIATLSTLAAVMVVAVAVVSTVGYLSTAAALEDARERRSEAEGERVRAKERLWEALTARGRAERLAGSRWAALEALTEAAQIKPGDALRREAIQAITSQGIRLKQTITFGQTVMARLSDDGSLLAVFGTPYDRSGKGASGDGIVVYRVADGREVDRVDFAVSGGQMNYFGFRPGSTVLAFDARPYTAGAGLVLRDVAASKEVGVVPNANGCLFSPDGAALATSIADSLHVIRSDDQKELKVFPGAHAVSFLSATEILISDRNHRLIGWDVKSDRETCSFQPPLNHSLAQYEPTESGRFAPLFDLTTPERMMTVWNVRTGKEVASLPEVSWQQYGARYTALTSVLAFGVKAHPEEVLLYDAVRKTSRRLYGAATSAVGNYSNLQRSALAPDGRLLAAYARSNNAADGANEINVWDAETGKIVASLREATCPMWSADGRSLAAICPGVVYAADGSGSMGGANVLVKVWEVADPAPTYHLDRIAESIASSPDGDRLAVNGQLWEVARVADRHRLKPLAAATAADSMAFARSGAAYAACLHQTDPSTGASLPRRVVELEPRRREIKVDFAEKIDGIVYETNSWKAVFSPDGRFVAVVSDRMGQVTEALKLGTGSVIDLWDLSSFERLRRVCGGQGNLKSVGKGSWSQSIDDVPTGRLGSNPKDLVFNSDSSMLAVAFNDGVVIFDMPEGKPIRWLRSDQAYCVAFAPDGKTVYYGAGGGVVNVSSSEAVAGEKSTWSTVTAKDGSWTVAEERPTLSFKGHNGTVRAIAISPDGRVLATGGEDRMIRLWDLPSGRPLAEWEAHDGHVTALHYRPEGGTLVSGGTDGTFKLWDLPMIRRELSAMGLDW